MKPRLRRTEKEFERAYGEFADPLFRFVRYRVSSREEALDIVGETFLRFWQSLRREDIKEPRAFLFRTARNLVVDWYRKKKTISIQDFGEDGPESSPAYLDMFMGNLPGPETELEAKIIIEKIRELEPIYREAVYLRYVEELTPREISEITGDLPSVISVRINRGMKLLKSKLRI